MLHPKKYIRITTSLSIATAAGIFKTSMTAGSLPLGLPATLFSRPSPSAFDSVDEDPPQLSVSAEVPTSPRARSVFHLYAWDQGGRRRLEVVSFGGFLPMGVRAELRVGNFVSDLRAADPELTVERGV